MIVHFQENTNQNEAAMQRMLSFQLRNLISIVFFFSLNMNLAAEVVKVLIMCLVSMLVV